MLGDNGHGRGEREDGVRGEQSEEEDEDDEEEDEEIEVALFCRLSPHRLFLEAEEKKMRKAENICKAVWASVRPLLGGSLDFAVAATDAGLKKVCGSHLFHLSAGITNVQLLQSASGKPQSRFHLEGTNKGLVNSNMRFLFTGISTHWVTGSRWLHV